MPKLLHILTRPPDDFVKGLVATQETTPENRVVIADLTGAEPDYVALVQQVLEADSIASW